MVKTRYYSWGEYKRIIKFSDKDFTQALLTEAIKIKMGSGTTIAEWVLI